jgi:hypothetical protein
MKKLWYVTLLSLVSLAGVSCRKERRTDGRQLSELRETKDSSYRCRQVQPIDGRLAWPIPDDAEQTSKGVYTKSVLKGGGKRPKVGSGQVLLLCVTYYAKNGTVVEHDPMVVHNIDLPPKEWQEVLSRMAEGDVRRFWISPRAHIRDFAIGDFEVQPFPQYIPARTPPAMPRPKR